MKTLFVICTCCLFSFTSAQKKPLDVHKFLRQDTTQAISESQLKAIANATYLQSYKTLTPEERSATDRYIKRLEKKDSILQVAFDLSTTGNILMAQGKSPSMQLALTAAAVKAAPQVAVLNNNFGAALHRADSLKTSLKVLLYAKSQTGQLTPVILTNLGNVLFELSDDRSAEVFYRRALWMDKKFRLAREGLVLCYLKRKDIGKAYEELLAGVDEVSFSPVTKLATDVIKNNGDKEKRKNSPSRPPRPTTSGPDGKVPVPVKDLVLPEFPNWADRNTMMHAAGSIDNWKKDLDKQSKEVDQEIDAMVKKEIAELQSVAKLPYAEQVKLVNKYTKNYRMQKLTYGLDLLGFYYTDEIDKIWHQAHLKEEAAVEAFKKEFGIFSTAYDLQHKELLKQEPLPVKALESFYIEQCKKKQILVDGYYNKWREIAKERHNKTNDLLREYWIYAEPYLNQVYDLNMFNRLDAQRRQFVFGKLAVFPTLYSFNNFGFAFMGIDIAGGIGGKCAEKQDEPETKTEQIKTDVPKSKASDCPFDGKIKIGLGMASIGLDCTSIEVEAIEGVGGAVKYDFKAKETTIFVGVGYKAELNFPGAENLPGMASAEASVKAGPYIKFNGQGEIIDYGALMEVGGTVSLGKNSAGVTHTSITSSVTGINSELGTEISRKVF